MAKGRLTLVSLGPGGLEHLTPAARSALATAEVVIGYGVYLDLIASLLRPEQRLLPRPLGTEVQRSREALLLAAEGHAVALISSGDIGMYAMAGPLFEQLDALGWSPAEAPEISVVPGVSAVQAAAARLGAPIAHDFCCISLSDRLTSWELIARRVEAAAAADFVVAFYNPRSVERHWQLGRARDLLLVHRSPETPDAVVRAVTRPDEHITLTTLAALDVSKVDMFSLVLVGNSQTRRSDRWLLTPRGYRVAPDAESGSQAHATVGELRSKPQ